MFLARIDYIFKYEPIYIARADSPQFDERFIGFGMTRNSQVRVINYLGKLDGVAPLVADPPL